MAKLLDLLTKHNFNMDAEISTVEENIPDTVTEPIKTLPPVDNSTVENNPPDNDEKLQAQIDALIEQNQKLTASNVKLLSQMSVQDNKPSFEECIYSLCVPNSFKEQHKTNVVFDRRGESLWH